MKEEKEKLNQYRESVRSHYSELRAGTKGLPTDLAQPLFVGQRIIAVHPRTREIYDGSVLTVEHSRYRVKFDKHELGIEFVQVCHCISINILFNQKSLGIFVLLFDNHESFKSNNRHSGFSCAVMAKMMLKVSGGFSLILFTQINTSQCLPVANFSFQSSLY